MTAVLNQSAVVQLYIDVANYFSTLGLGASVVFGFRERWKQINEGTGGANRVCVIPGRLPNGEDGPLEGAVGPGEFVNADQTVDARALFSQQKILTFSMWAADTVTGTEAAQQTATEQMFEWVCQACKRSVAGASNAIWGSCRYNANPNERRFGLEYLAELSLETLIFDAPPGIAFPTNPVVNRGEIT